MTMKARIKKKVLPLVIILIFATIILKDSSGSGKLLLWIIYIFGGAIIWRLLKGQSAFISNPDTSQRNSNNGNQKTRPRPTYKSTTQRTCGGCNGSGYSSNQTFSGFRPTCPVCKGTGFV